MKGREKKVGRKFSFRLILSSAVHANRNSRKKKSKKKRRGGSRTRDQLLAVFLISLLSMGLHASTGWKAKERKRECRVRTSSFFFLREVLTGDSRGEKGRLKGRGKKIDSPVHSASPTYCVSSVRPGYRGKRKGDWGKKDGRVTAQSFELG